MGPDVRREARLVCVSTNEFGGAKDRGEYRQLLSRNRLQVGNNLGSSFG
jgi:hypothetical protein